VLADPEQRAAYDVKYDENRATVVNVLERVSSGDGFGADRRLFDGVLSLLYLARRRDPNLGGLGIVQIERLDSGLFAITVNGIDRVVDGNALLLRRDRLLKPGPEDGVGPPDGPAGPGGAGRGPGTSSGLLYGIPAVTTMKKNPSGSTAAPELSGLRNKISTP
jgi:hypothetical protein